jgi:hypothetical protein
MSGRKATINAADRAAAPQTASTPTIKLADCTFTTRRRRSSCGLFQQGPAPAR